MYIPSAVTDSNNNERDIPLYHSHVKPSNSTKDTYRHFGILCHWRETVRIVTKFRLYIISFVSNFKAFDLTYAALLLQSCVGTLFSIKRGYEIRSPGLNAPLWNVWGIFNREASIGHAHDCVPQELNTNWIQLLSGLKGGYLSPDYIDGSIRILTLSLNQPSATSRLPNWPGVPHNDDSWTTFFFCSCLN